MADLEKIVKIIFAGDDSDLARTINSVGGGMDKLALNVGKATQPLADLTDSILKIDAVLAGLAAGALVVVTTAAGRFGDSFAEIATLIDAPAGALLEFKDDILDYSRDSTASLEGITGATYQIISATEDWENALETLSAAERLNVAGKGELDSTTKLLVTSLNAYGQGVEGAADFSDILFTTVRVGVTNLTELSASLGTVTGLASSAGVPFVDLNAAVGALTGTVGDTSLAVTQIKGILTAIIKPSAQAADAAEELGIQFNTQALAAMGLEKFLQMVYEATDGNTTVMARLFGRMEGLNGALVLGADASGKYASALRGMEERAGATDAAYAKMVENFAIANQKLINNLQATLIEAGTPLLDEWGAIVDSIVNIFKGVSVGFDEGSFDPLIQYIEKVGQAIATEFEGIAEALPEALAGIDWSEFTQSLDGLVAEGKNLFIELFGNLDLTKPEDLERALQKVIDTFEKWVDLTSGVVSGLAPFLGMLADLASEFSEVDGETLKGAGSIAGWGKAINVVAGIVPSLTAPLGLLSASIGLLSITQIPTMIMALPVLGTALVAIGAVLGPVILMITTFVAAYKFGEVVGKDIPILGQAGIAFGNLAFAIKHLGDDSAEAMAKQAAHTQELGDAAVAIARVQMELENLTPEQTVEVNLALGDFFDDIDAVDVRMSLMKNTEIEITADASQVEAELHQVEEWNRIILGDGTVIPVSVDATGAAASAQKAKDDIDKILPHEKLLEIKLQGDIDIELQRIKSAAESLQAAFEWEAKIEIAAIEADARRIEAIAASISVAWQSTGDVISAAFGILSDPNLAFGDYRTIIRLIEAESGRRAELLVMQKKLTEAEIAHIKERTKAIKSGQGVITISADGIEPELEMVLQKIIKLAQIQANEEGFGMLLGI
jgi:TP901 family phage tail tape measure protein